jgi:hypothetical protein
MYTSTVSFEEMLGVFDPLESRTFESCQLFCWQQLNCWCQTDGNINVQTNYFIKEIIKTYNKDHHLAFSLLSALSLVLLTAFYIHRQLQRYHATYLPPPSPAPFLLFLSLSA